MKYDLLHIQGKPYVLVPLHDYRKMTSGGGETQLPDAILDEISAQQDHPIKIVRKHRGMTQAALAKESEISRPYLTEIETGKKDGSLRAMKAIADALNVSLSDLT